MLPKELHIEQINRFFNAIENLDRQIELEDNPDTKLELLRMYYKLTSKTWLKLDNFTEELKNEISTILKQ